MHPAFSVIFLTTLIGVGQGLFLALVTGQSYAAIGFIEIENASRFYAHGSMIALTFLITGLIASFFHLGHPERAWRSAAKWRTSWLSREVIALPVFMAAVFVYGLLHYMGWDFSMLQTQNPAQGQASLFIGIIGTLLCFVLFICTGMIYACLKFIQEWHNPLTLINYTLFGAASGFLFASAMSAHESANLMKLYGVWATIITGMVFITRIASLIRNARIKYKSSLQSAIGVRHNQIQQKAQGAMGGSFNTREFFHGKSAVFFKSIKWIFLVLVFPVPMALLWAGMQAEEGALLFAAFGIQYVGLLAERWFFFAQAKHPQNLYYQVI